MTGQLLRFWAIFCTVSVLFIFSMFYRVSNAVIAPDLVREFQLSAENLGMLGGAFFYSFALMQIPMGVMLDRIGPRVVMTVFGLLGATGAFVFAESQTFVAAVIGRILIGAGMACALMGSFKIFVLRFSPSKFSTLSGSLVSIGALGAILATSPLAWLAIHLGWRITFRAAGCITALCSALIFWVTKGTETKGKGSGDNPNGVEKNIPMRELLHLVAGNLSFWQIATFAFFRYGTFVALQGLWLGTYLMDVKNFSPVQAGNILMMLSVGYIAGAPIGGYLADRVVRSAKVTGLCSVILYTLCILPLTGIVDVRNPVHWGILFCMIGFFNSPGTLAYTHVKNLYPIQLSGTVIAAVNFFVMAGGAILTPLLGVVIEAMTPQGQTYAAPAYHTAFLICFIGTVGSLVFYAFSKGDRGAFP